MNQHIKEYLRKHRDLISQNRLFDLFDKNNLVYPYVAYKDEILKMLQDAGLIEQDKFYLEKINNYTIAVAKRVNDFIEKEYGDKLKNPVGSIKALTLENSLPNLAVVMNDPGMHQAPVDQNIIWWVERGYLKGSIKLENGKITTESKNIYTYTPFKELLQNPKKCEDDDVEQITQKMEQAFETIEKELLEDQETSKTVEEFVSSTISILKKQLVENNYSNIDVSYIALNVSEYKIIINLKSIKKKMTTTKMQGGVGSLVGQDGTLDKIHDDLTNLGFIVNSVTMETSFPRGIAVPTLYIRVENK